MGYLRFSKFTRGGRPYMTPRWIRDGRPRYPAGAVRDAVNGADNNGLAARSAWDVGADGDDVRAAGVAKKENDGVRCELQRFSGLLLYDEHSRPIQIATLGRRNHRQGKKKTARTPSTTTLRDLL